MSSNDTERPRGRDGEVLDYVARKGPITANRIVKECGIWSPDEVYTSLQSLENDCFIESQEGELKEHGTTRRVWYVETATEHEEYWVRYPDHPDQRQVYIRVLDRKRAEIIGEGDDPDDAEPISLYEVWQTDRQSGLSPTKQHLTPWGDRDV